VNILKSVLFALLAVFLISFYQEGTLFWQDIFVAVSAGAIFLFITYQKSENKFALPILIVLPLIFVLIHLQIPALQILPTLIIAFLWGEALWEIKKDKMFWAAAAEGKKNKDLLSWRTWLRPLLVVFPLFLIFFGKEFALGAAGIFAGFFLLVDILRMKFLEVSDFLLSKFFLKEREKRMLSSFTFFGFGIFLIFLFFSVPVAFSAAIFLIFGDLFAKIFRILYGQRKFFKKSLEGALAYFASSLMLATVLFHFFDLPFIILFIGAGTAALVESLPLEINDNLTAGFAAGGAMFLAQLIF
jgi:dolichol kinase